MTDVDQHPAVTPPATILTSPARRRRLPSGPDLGRRFGLVGVWAVLIVFFGILKPDIFLTWSNFRTMFDSQAVLLLLALALVISLVSGDFDLSVAGVFSACLVLIGRLNIVDHLAFGVAITAAIALGLVIGCVHAFLIVKLGLSSFIVTLGSGTAFMGLGYALNPQAISGVSSDYTRAMTASFGGLQVAFLIAVVVVVLMWYVYGHTPLGRRLFFVGASPDVARLAGLRVSLLRSGSLIAASVLAAVTAAVAGGYLDGADPNVAANFLLPAAAGALLGSTAIWPGRPNPWGSFVAMYFLVTGYTGLEELGLSGWIQQVFYGGALVVAIAVSRLASAGVPGADGPGVGV